MDAPEGTSEIGKENVVFMQGDTVVDQQGHTGTVTGVLHTGTVIVAWRFGQTRICNTSDLRKAA